MLSKHSHNILAQIPDRRPLEFSIVPSDVISEPSTPFNIFLSTRRARYPSTLKFEKGPSVVYRTSTLPPPKTIVSSPMQKSHNDLLAETIWQIPLSRQAGTITPARIYLLSESSLSNPISGRTHHVCACVQQKTSMSTATMTSTNHF